MIETARGGLVAKHEFQDAASAEKSALLNIIRLSARGLKTCVSGILEF